MKAMIKTESAAVDTQIVFNGNLIDRFIDFVDSASAQTIKTYVASLKKFYRFLRDNNIAQPTREDIKLYRDELEATLRPSSVKLHLNAVKMFFAWLSSENFYPNISVNIKKHSRDEKPELATHKRAALSATEVAKVLKLMPSDDSIASLRNRTLIVLLACTGIRRAEAASLNKNSIKAQGGKFYVEFTGKGNKQATVILPRQCYSMIQALFKAYEKESGKKVKSADPIFISVSRRNYGKRLGTDAIGRIAQNALRAAGFEEERIYSCHSFRHAFASIALELSESDVKTGRLNDTISLHSIQISMRHSSLKTTEFYLHDRDLTNNPVSKRVADCIFNFL